MSLRTAFPRTFSLDPDVLNWSMPFSWMYPELTPLNALWDAQEVRMARLTDFWAWTEAMVDDLNGARSRAGTRSETEAIDCVRFITCIPALHSAKAAGQMGVCYDWIWTAVAHTHVRGQRINSNVYSFLNCPHVPNALYMLYLDHVPQFADACFYVAYKFGGLDDLTAAVAADSWRVASDLHRSNPNDALALEAMAQMVIWAAYRNWPDGEAWAGELLSAAERTSSPRQRLQVFMTFITPANRYVEGTPKTWAEGALRDYGEAMVEHERLQTYSVLLSSPEDWRARRGEILEEISKLRTEYLAGRRDGQSDLEVLEQRVSVIHPLIYGLANWGEIENVVEVLGAWYRAPSAAPADANILAVIPSHNGGVAYLWPGGRWLTGTGDTSTYDLLQRATGTALGEYFRGTDGDHSLQAYEDFRFQVVNPAAGHDFETAMMRHYRFDELKDHLPVDWTPRATVVFPAGHEPVQAMLIKAAQLAAPLEISFEDAQPSRPIRRIAVWTGGLLHETFELEAIRHVAERSGWVVQSCQSTEPTSEELRQFYEDEEADIVWVISHGSHDPFSVGGTGLHLAEELVDLEDLRGWRIPGQGRRLLVLNSCSGATTQIRGGLARIGLAQTLVSSRQAVVGHLWPVHWTAGLAFGAALAACLEENSTESAALIVVKLMQEPERLRSFLEDRFRGYDDLLDRLRRADEDLSSLTNWGCPVLLT